MKIQIKTLSPLHIGDGNEVTTMNSFKNIDKTYIINETKMFAFMDNIMKKRFNSWIETEIFKEWGRGASPKIADFLYKNENTALKKELLKTENTLYKINGSSNKSFKTLIKSVNKIYLPGSEIKGAIRTALLYKTLKDNKELYNNFEKEIIAFKTIKLKLKNGYFSVEEIINSVADRGKKENDIYLKEQKYSKNYLKNEVVKSLAKISSKIEENIFNTISSDAKYDILKYLRVSDSNLKDVEEYCEIKEVNTLFTTAKENVECINPNKKFDIKIEFENLSKVIEKIEENNKGKLYEEIMKKKDLLSIDFIKEALYEYAEDILEVEESYSKYNNDMHEKIAEIRTKNSKENPLIRIGKYKGYLSETISLLVRNNNFELYDSFFAHCTKGTSYYKNTVQEIFPKTRRISEDETFGWCKLIFTEEEKIKIKEKEKKEFTPPKVEKKIYTEKPTFEQYLSEKPDLAKQSPKKQEEYYNKFLQKHGFN